MAQSGRLAALAIAALLALAGCSRRTAGPVDASTRALPARVGVAEAPAPRASAASPPDGALEMLEVPFDELYPIFLVRHSMPLGEKAALWHDRYFGKWVRWTGVLRSFTDNGITVRQYRPTVTFDVSLWVEAAERPLLRQKLHPGARVTYIGRLDSYDDVFRTLYLTHGAIVEPPDPPVDGGF